MCPHTHYSADPDCVLPSGYCSHYNCERWIAYRLWYLCNFPLCVGSSDWLFFIFGLWGTDNMCLCHCLFPNVSPFWNSVGITLKGLINKHLHQWNSVQKWDKPNTSNITHAYLLSPLLNFWSVFTLFSIENEFMFTGLGNKLGSNLLSLYAYRELSWDL